MHTYMSPIFKSNQLRSNGMGLNWKIASSLRCGRAMLLVIIVWFLTSLNGNDDY